MRNPANQKSAARQFVEFWRGKGYEKGQTQPFWLHLLRVLGVDAPETAIEFEDKAQIVEYELRAAVISGSGDQISYANTYPLKVYEYGGTTRNATVKGIASAKYQQHRQNIHGKIYIVGDNPPNMIAPYARSFLKLFYEKGETLNGIGANLRPTSSESLLINAFSQNSDCFAEWLTHNSGAPFSSSGISQLTRYLWNASSPVSQFMSQRTPFSLKDSTNIGGTYHEFATDTGTRLKQFYDSCVKIAAEAFLANATNGTEVTMPMGGWYEEASLASSGVFSSLSPSWVPGLTVVVGSSANYGGYEALFSQFVIGSSAFDDYDAWGTIGRGRILNPRYRFTIRKTSHAPGPDTYDVVGVDFQCAIEDLYDFNYEDGDLPANAAALQIGYGNGSVPGRSDYGKIYRHRIEISTTYSNPFDYANIILPQ